MSDSDGLMTQERGRQTDQGARNHIRNTYIYINYSGFNRFIIMLFFKVFGLPVRVNVEVQIWQGSVPASLYATFFWCFFDAQLLFNFAIIDFHGAKRHQEPEIVPQPRLPA